MSEVIQMHVQEVVKVAIDPPTGTITITENGETNVFDYATANVQVPQGVFPEGTLQITQNGEATVTTYDKVNVAVPGPSGKITITENGTGLDIASYATADVAVPQGITPSGSQTYTQNGTYDVTSLAEAVVAVPEPSGSISITQNANNIDVSAYATANVNVPSVDMDEAIAYVNAEFLRGCD